MSINTLRVSSYTARNLARRQIDLWGEDSKSRLDEVVRVLKETLALLRRSSSPAKTLEAARRRLVELISKREMGGQVILINSRHLKYMVAFPSKTNDRANFPVVFGEINARGGTMKIDSTIPIEMSLHALQRLGERLNAQGSKSVLHEIYSCIFQADRWNKGAMDAGAKCWPLLSASGFFVCSANTGTPTATVVTWMRCDQVGEKWGAPISALERLREVRPDRLEDSEFSGGFVRSFPWMLHEHAPGEDLMSRAWESRFDDARAAKHRDDNFQDERKEKDSHDRERLQKLSKSYVSGLNYAADRPPFETHTLHEGFVVQLRENGGLIVTLRNGWVGQVPRQSIERGASLLGDFRLPRVGELVNVCVHKIRHLKDEGAYFISLDLQELYEASWSATLKDYPIGKKLEVKLEHYYVREFLAVCGDGVRGVIPKVDVRFLLTRPWITEAEALGQCVESVVVGYRSDKRLLVLAADGVNGRLKSSDLPADFTIGAQVSGACVKVAAGRAWLELPGGFFGVLAMFDNWGRELPAVGEIAIVRVARSGGSVITLEGLPPEGVSKVFRAAGRMSAGKTSDRDDLNIGTVVEVQIRFWSEKHASFFVVAENGVVGLLSGAEVDWACVFREEQREFFRPGDISSVMVSKVHPQKGHVAFSRKALVRHPLDVTPEGFTPGSCLDAVVVNVVDYGCFVYFPPSGLQALLHRSKMPEGARFVRGQKLRVQIESLDQQTKRVSVRLATCEGSYGVIS